jgi:hypothetical protein
VMMPAYHKNSPHAPGMWGVCRLDRWIVFYLVR